MTRIPTKTTAAACARQDCQGCQIDGKLLCIHTGPDLLDFLALVAIVGVPMLAGMIIGQHWLGLAIWFGFCVIFFGYVEALILCRHCPHYAEEGFLLKCHANSGLPKIPKFDPRPLSKVEQIAWLVYAGVICLWYVPFFIVGGQWLLLAITTVSLVSAVWTLLRTQCNRCYNLSCPVNRVPEEVREVFFENYPQFAQAWGRSEHDQ